MNELSTNQLSKSKRDSIVIHLGMTKYSREKTGKLMKRKWSEYKDSNLGPPGPKPGALPDCATLRLRPIL